MTRTEFVETAKKAKKAIIVCGDSFCDINDLLLEASKSIEIDSGIIPIIYDARSKINTLKHASDDDVTVLIGAHRSDLENGRLDSILEMFHMHVESVFILHENCQELVYVNT